MPPRSYYVEPRATDYIAFATAFFPNDLDAAREFSTTTGLPYISDAIHLASYVGISPSLIRQILHRQKYHYRFFSIDKIDGTKREIATPKTYLKVIQWWILDNILSRKMVHPANHGFVGNRSYVTNATSHLGCKHILNLDIRQFFPNIGFNKIKDVFRNIGYGDGGADVLASITSLDRCAPTGAPTSPMIGNLVLSVFDSEFAEHCAKLGFNYTRYADDITVSSQEMISEEFLDFAVKCVERHGFQVNAKKTKFMGRGNRMEVTGLTINNGVNLSADWRNTMRGILHRAIHNPQDYTANKAYFAGIYGTLLALDPEKSKKLTRAAELALEKIRLPKKIGE